MKTIIDKMYELTQIRKGNISDELREFLWKKYEEQIDYHIHHHDMDDDFEQWLADLESDKVLELLAEYKDLRKI